MGLPPMPHTVTVENPGPSTTDPKTGNELPGAVVPVVTRAYLAQKTPTELGAQVELLASQDTTISLWTLIVPLSVTLTSKSTIVDSAGRRMRIVGQVASRPDMRPRWKVAAVRLVSDLDGV